MARTEEQKVKHREANRRWYTRNREIRRAINREYYEVHSGVGRKANRKRRYGMTSEEYEQRLTTQNGVCAICGGNRSRQELGVDHNHTTGIVRGLLCGKCNLAIGGMDDNPDFLRKAADYLEQHA